MEMMRMDCIWCPRRFACLYHDFDDVEDAARARLTSEVNWHYRKEHKLGAREDHP